MVLAGEEWLALEHFGKDTASAPDIDLDIVFLPCEHDLGRPVVSCRYVTCHLGVLNTGQAEVANLEIAILVNQNVAGFQVPVHHASRVHVFQTSHDLVQEILDELLLEGPGGQQPVQVSPQELGDEVDVLEGRNEDIAEGDDVLVPEVLEQFQLTVGPLGQDGGAEGLHDLLDGNILAGELVSGGTNQTKGSHAHRLQVRVPRCDLEGRPKDLGADEFSHDEYGSGSRMVRATCRGGINRRGRDRREIMRF